MDGGNVCAAEGFQEITHRAGRKLRIISLDGDKEFVFCNEFESVPIEKLMVQAGQTVQQEHSKDSREGREKNGQLKHDRKESRNGEEIRGFSGNDERVEER